MVVSESSALRYALDPDVRLMLEVRDGSAAAFEELVLRYQVRLLRVLEHLVGSRELAEDLAQEVFLRVYRAREQYVAGAKFATWLFTIANNAASNALRNRARRHEINLYGRDSGPMGARPLDRLIQAGSGGNARPATRQGGNARYRAAGHGVAFRAAAAGRAAEQVRGHELRRHRRKHGDVAPGRQVVVVAGEGESSPGAGTVFHRGAAAGRWKTGSKDKCPMLNDQ